ncbi:MAG: hypothetical protein ACRC62_27185, partial [Microcoleus sp.]
MTQTLIIYGGVPTVKLIFVNIIEGRGKKEEGRGKREEGRGKREEQTFSLPSPSPNLPFPPSPLPQSPPLPLSPSPLSLKGKNMTLHAELHRHLGGSVVPRERGRGG